MGTPLGPKYIPYTYMDPLGIGDRCKVYLCLNFAKSIENLS